MKWQPVLYLLGGTLLIVFLYRISWLAAQWTRDPVLQEALSLEPQVGNEIAPSAAVERPACELGAEQHWLIDNEKNGSGVLMFAYSADPATLEHYLSEAVEGAKTLRELNPTLRIALAVNPQVNVTAGVFNDIVRIRPDHLFLGLDDRGDKVLRQFLTRVYYLAMTPYAITLALDSNTVCCSSTIAALLESDAVGDVDIAVNSQLEGYMWPHNWAILYRWNERTSDLFRDWFLLQLRYHVAKDDQSTLQEALKRAWQLKRIKLGKLRNNFASSFLHLSYEAPVVSQTRLLSPGPVHLVHLGTSKHLCLMWNTHSNASRLLVNLDWKQFPMVLSQNDCHELVARTKPGVKCMSMDWGLSSSLPPAMVSPIDPTFRDSDTSCPL